jgi:putative ABC transport system ATP-binding protein
MTTTLVAAAAQAVAATKQYGTGDAAVRALDEVTLDIPRARLTAIMGPSGSGKSTLLSILGCLERPTEGSYRLAGEEVAGFDERKAARVRRERIGFVFQGFNLLLRSTAAQNVELPLSYAGVGRRERRERAGAALDAVGLSDRAGHLPSQLSGGQQQRVAVARAIVTRPDVVLADEPTGNLDSHSQEEVLELLAGLHARGATIVMVTHSREVAEHATRIVHVLDGLIDADEALARRAAP